jgi:pyruvate,water dikinase
MGLRVPPGFALSVQAYRDFMRLTGATEEITACLEESREALESIQGLEEVSRRVRSIIETKTVPAQMDELIRSHYEQLCAKCNRDAVEVSTRSAGATSHPGQYETHLNVVGEDDVVQKIIRVWSSTFNTRSLAMRHRKRLPLVSDPIGVAVLKMVRARCAGVMFTADPNTGDTSRMIIEANWGLGESVVGGEATPDVFILNKESLEVEERRLGDKSTCVIFREKGVSEEETPDNQRCRFCVKDEELQELGRIGKELEKYFGVPQDAEWAVEEGVAFPESVMMLQTRAEVIVPAKSPVDQVLDLMINRFSN